MTRTDWPIQTTPRLQMKPSALRSSDRGGRFDRPNTIWQTRAGGGSFGAGHVVRNQDTFSVVAFDRHRHLYINSHIISFPPEGRKYSSRGLHPSDRGRGKGLRPNA